MRGDRQFVTAVAASAFIGAAAWRGPLYAVALPMLIPALCFTQAQRARAAAVALAYFAAASFPMIEAYRAFEHGSRWNLAPLMMWLVAAGLLTLPWAAFWTFPERTSLWRVAGAFAVTAVPPLGLIGWASPIVAAGVLFPGTGWLGLLATVVIAGSLASRERRLLAVLMGALTATVANIAYSERPLPDGWEALRTASGSTGQDHVTPWHTSDAVQQVVIRSRARVLIFAEGVVTRWNAATDAFWEDTIMQLAAEGRTALVGAAMPIPGRAEYRNAAVLIGAEGERAFSQRVPVPLAMWKPFGPRDGVPLRLTGPGTVDIGRHRAAILICYEQLLVWPMLHSALERPSVLVGMTSVSWTKHTSIPAAQTACLKSWSRVFRIPLLIAINE